MTQPDIPGFTGQPGLKKHVQGTKPTDYYRLFLTDDIVQHFVTETNLHAEQVIAVSRPQKRFARLKDRTETDAGEMKKFLGQILLTGIVSKPTLASYWSTSVLLNTPIFSLVMPRNHFQSLLRFWHCNDNSKEPARNDHNRDRLNKIRPLVQHLQEEFQSVNTPSKYVAIDESLLLWKGQLIFKQYIPLKRARFGIKLFNVCEDSGYTYKFHIYTGKEDPAFQIQQHIPDDAAHLAATEKIVFMTMNLQNKGYHLFMDNWYSGSRLYQYMKSKATMCCGTLRENRAPTEVRALEVSHEVPVKALRSGSLLFLKWQSSKVVYMLSTMRDESMKMVERRGRDVLKPVCVVDYNSKMGAVDKADQLLQPYDAMRKTTRWYKKVVVHLLQGSLLNAYLIFKKDQQSSMDFLDFQLKVVSDLLYSDNSPPVADPACTEDFTHLKERHFPARSPQLSGTQATSRKCKVCLSHGTRKETVYQCS